MEVFKIGFTNKVFSRDWVRWEGRGQQSWSSLNVNLQNEPFD